MLAKIRPQKMGGCINSIESKSYAHRIILAAALCDSQTKIEISSLSKDIEATLSCVKALGGKVKIKNGYIYVDKVELKNIKEAQLNCIESGSTLRFILPIIAALNVNSVIDGLEGLRKRPIDELTQVLKAHGASIDKDTLPLKISGPLNSGEYKIRGDISSQYITGLLYALPLLKGDSRIIVTTPIVSKKYLDITIDVLSQFGIIIEETDYGYFVKGDQKYLSPKQIKVQGDWSNAAFFLTLGAINGDIEMSGLSLTSKQGDREIIQVLMDMGAKVVVNKDKVVVKKSKLHSISLDIKDIPDLAPIISILMANADGISEMKNVDRLKIKETDRLAAIIDTLSKMGIKCRYKDNTLEILAGKIHAFKNGSYNDHRMVMMQAIAASIADGECEIEGCEAKDKSYPNFFEDFKILNGDVDVK